MSRRPSTLISVMHCQPDRRLVRRRPLDPVLHVRRDVHEIAGLHLRPSVLLPRSGASPRPSTPLPTRADPGRTRSLPAMRGRGRRSARCGRGRRSSRIVKSSSGNCLGMSARRLVSVGMAWLRGRPTLLILAPLYDDPSLFFEEVAFGIQAGDYSLPAERTGFEPADQFPGHRFSKPALSTTQPPLRDRKSLYINYLCFFVLASFFCQFSRVTPDLTPFLATG